jgi:hypothetical protein
MTKRANIVVSIIGFAATVVAAVLLNRAASVESIDLVILGLNVVAAGIAGRMIIGRVRVHRYFALGMVVLFAVAAAILTSSATNYLISQDVSFGKADPVPNPSVVTAAVIGFVVYLLAATVYGFAGVRQMIGVGSRIGFLLLLLLAVLPLLNVLGLIGFTVLEFTRKPTTTPEPAAVSG